MGIVEEDLKNKKFHQLYLLYGEEGYLRNGYAHALAKALIPDGNSMNFNHYVGENMDEREVISQADTMPFFAECRVILIEDTGIFTRAANDLADYVTHLPEYLVMIFSEEKINATYRLTKAVKKNGCVEEYKKRTEEQLSAQILTRLKKEGRKIRRQTMDQLLQMVGTDMTNVHNEMDKLMSYVMSPDRPTAGKDPDEITEEDLNTILAPELEDRIFQMIDEISFRHQKKALDYYYDLLELKVAPEFILNRMSARYAELYHVRVMTDQHASRNEIMQTAGVSSGKLYYLSRTAGMYKAPELRAILEKLIQAEQDVKTGHLDGRLAAEMMIVQCSSLSEQP